MERLSWDDYFLKEIVPAVAKRATCDRGRSGAIIVKDKRILTTGYVGSPSGLPHCDDVGHLIHEVIDENGVKSKHCVRTLHAEENAILQAAKFGISIEGATIYCSMVPCFRCAMKMALSQNTVLEHFMLKKTPFYKRLNLGFLLKEQLFIAVWCHAFDAQ